MRKASTTVPLTLENSAARDLMRRKGLLVLICCLLLSGCRSGKSSTAASVEFSRVPMVDEGGTGKMVAIEGRVTGARPGQQIVLFARSGAWYVQPFTDQPFTKIQPDSTWRNSTHLGTEYAALLVEPGYYPPAKADVLPTGERAIIARAVVKGEVRLLVPMFWEMWWFRLSSGLAGILALLAFHHLRLSQMTRQLNARFEERLVERMRIAQELHDTLLQGVLSASMQLHVAIERLPQDSPVKEQLNHVQRLMGWVIEEGQKTVRGLRSITADSLDLEQAFSNVQKELAIQQQIEFHMIVEGQPRLLHPIIRDEVYRIGRGALVNAFRQSHARNVEIELKYAARQLRIIVRNDGPGLNSQALTSGQDEYSALSEMRERAEKIGARLKVRNYAAAGTEVELSVPSKVAYLNGPSIRPLRWLTGSALWRAGASGLKRVTKRDN